MGAAGEAAADAEEAANYSTARRQASSKAKQEADVKALEAQDLYTEAKAKEAEVERLWKREEIVRAEVSKLRNAIEDIEKDVIRAEETAAHKREMAKTAKAAAEQAAHELQSFDRPAGAGRKADDKHRDGRDESDEGEESEEEGSDSESGSGSESGSASAGEADRDRRPPSHRTAPRVGGQGMHQNQQRRR